MRMASLFIIRVMYYFSDLSPYLFFIMFILSNPAFVAAIRDKLFDVI